MSVVGLKSLLDDSVMIFGTRVIQSELATRDGGQAKKFPKRKAKTEAHHRRMNKKWLKRYGTIREPAMYWLDPSLLGDPHHRFASKVLVCHPSLYPNILDASMRAAAKSA